MNRDRIIGDLQREVTQLRTALEKVEKAAAALLAGNAKDTRAAVEALGESVSKALNK